MTSDLKKLKKLVLFCKRHGISSFKNEDIEFQLEKEFMPKPKTRKVKQDVEPGKAPEVNLTDMPTDEELLYLSSDYDPNENKNKKEFVLDEKN